jgi:hypothetical protein
MNIFWETSVPLFFQVKGYLYPNIITYSHFYLKAYPLIGTVKGRTAIRILNRFKQLKKKSYWGNHFWAKGYCVDTVGLNEEMIRKYIKYQEVQEKRFEQMQLF